MTTLDACNDFLVVVCQTFWYLPPPIPPPSKGYYKSKLDFHTVDGDIKLKDLDFLTQSSTQTSCVHVSHGILSGHDKLGGEFDQALAR